MKYLIVQCPKCQTKYSASEGHKPFSCIVSDCESPIYLSWDNIPSFLLKEEEQIPKDVKPAPLVLKEPKRDFIFEPPILEEQPKQKNPKQKKPNKEQSNKVAVRSAPKSVRTARPPRPQTSITLNPTPLVWGGVGTELKKLIPDLLLYKGCQCTEYAAQMDAWGIRGCIVRREEIVKHLVGEATKVSYGIIPEFASEIGARKLLDRAISKAKQSNTHILDSKLVAVTSLSPNPKRIRRQQHCLKTWHDFGISTYVLNTKKEIDEMYLRYPMISNWIESDDVSTHYDRPCQRIWALAQVANKLNTPILLINSDIEIHGETNQLIDKIGPNTLTVGIRYNYRKGKRKDAVLERWGIDAFIFTPEMVKTLPEDMPTAIGQPFHDYLTVIHFQSLNYKIHLIGDPLFYHEDHPLHWSRNKWALGAQWTSKRYGIQISTYEESAAWRRSLPFGDNHDQT